MECLGESVQRFWTFTSCVQQLQCRAFLFIWQHAERINAQMCAVSQIISQLIRLEKNTSVRGETVWMSHFWSVLFVSCRNWLMFWRSTGYSHLLQKVRFFLCILEILMDSLWRDSTLIRSKLCFWCRLYILKKFEFKVTILPF